MNIINPTQEKENGKYTRTWTAAEFADAEKTVTEDNNLVLTKSVNTSCKSGTYGDNVVCLEVGRKLNFRCKYQLGEKVVSSQVNVSGQDKEDDATTAEGTGKTVELENIYNARSSFKNLFVLEP